MMVPLDYDNWGVGQLANLFSGDSVYLSTADYKFYVNPGVAMINPGIVCQSNILGLTANQINIAVINQTNVFGVPTNTSGSVCAQQFYFSVNVTSNGVNPLNYPSQSAYATALQACSKTILANTTVYTLKQSFYVEICGPISLEQITTIKAAVLETWLTARPEFVWCTRQRNCLQIINILNERIGLDEWNDITRIYYVVSVNNVTLDPSQNNYAPSIEIIKSTIQKIHKNLYQKFLLCGALVDSTHIYSYIIEALTIYAPFPLPLSDYVTDQLDSTRQVILSLLQRAIVATNPYVVDLSSLVIMLNDDYQDVLVLKTFYDNIGTAGFYISNDLVYVYNFSFKLD
jgi:hypothetical protein